MATDSQPIPISVRCLNTKLHAKAVFSNAGILTNLFARATGAAANAKNEKRYIKIFQSRPFRIGTRPDTEYELIYTSETFDDVSDICPSLLAYIKTFKDMDTQLRLSIYYNSSITGSKDVLLGLTNFTVADMLRSCSYNAVGTMSIDIHSEYCTGIKAYIEIIDPLPSPLDEHKLPILANRHEKNPLAQTYVFFNDVDLSSPLLKVVEQTWEPKFSGMVSLLFLENFLAAMRKSVVAWKLRQEQERIRQGKFMSDHEAFGYGWHVLEVTVRGARFAIQEQTNNPSLTLSPQPPAGVTPTANFTLRFPLTTEFVPDLDRVNPNAALLPPSPQLERRSRASSSHGLGPGSASTGGSFAGRGAGLVKSKSGRLTNASTATGATAPPTGKNGAVLPTKKYDDSAPSTFVQIYWEDPAKTFVEPIARTNTEYYTPFPVYGTNIHAQYARKGAHQQAVPLQEKIQVATVEKEVIYNVFEATNRSFLPKRWQTWTLTTASPSAAANRSRLSSHDEAVTANAAGAAGVSTVARTSDTGSVSTSTASTAATAAAAMSTAAMSTADDAGYVFDSQQAQHTTFKIYVANTHPQSQLRLDVMCETLQGHVKQMATCALPVADLTQFSGWLPLTMHKEHGHHHQQHQHSHSIDAAAAGPGAGPGGASAASAAASTAPATATTAAYDLGEILVDIKVHSPPPSSVPLQAASLPLDVMDEVFHLQRRTDGTVDLFSDATAIDYRYNLAQCYEWMWALGMHSQDPLLVDGGRSIASHLSRTDLDLLVDQMAAHETTTTTGPPSGAASPTLPPPPPPPSTPASSATVSAATSPRVRRPSVSFQAATSGGGVSSALSMDAAAPVTGRSLSGDSAPLPSSPAVVSTKSLPATDATVDGVSGGGGSGHDTGGVTVVERSLSADDLTDLVQQALDPRKPVRRGSKLLPTLQMDADSDDEDDDDDDVGGGGDVVGSDRALASTTGTADVSVDELSHRASHGALLASLLRMDAATDGDDAGDGDASAAAQSPTAAASDPPATTTTNDVLDVLNGPDGAAVTAADAAPTTTSAVASDEAVAANAAPSAAAAATAAATAAAGATPTVVSLSVDGVTTTLNPTATATAEASGGAAHRPPHRRASTTKISSKRRVDVTYDLSWIAQHVRELQDVIDEVELLLAGLRQKIRADRCFRSSVFKKEAEWQMLPTNLHYQIVGVQCHRPKRRGGAIAPDTSIPVDVIHSVTSGAMTPHMLKHKKGGLLHQEQDWDAKKSEVHILKGRFLAQVREYRQSVHGGLSPGRLRWLLPRDGNSSAYKTLLLLGGKVQAWESQAVEIGRRRMYAMSQSISIAVNSFLLKLNLLCQGAIEVSLAEKWLTAGFLLVFEGLLSVTGHEKSMLEDTITAVDALRNYRIRLLSKAQYVGSNTAKTKKSGATQTPPSVYQQNLTRQSSRYVTPATFARHRSTSQNSVRSSNSSSVADEAARASESRPAGGAGGHGAGGEQPPRAAEDGDGDGDDGEDEEDDDEEADLLADPDFTFQGREIRIYLSRAAIAMLPATYREAIQRGDGALVALFPVLFTQGIDMQQTMANTFGSDMAAFELQYLVNNRALQWVNAYCHRVQPLDSTSSHPHTYHAARTDDIVQLPHETRSGGGGGGGGASPVAMSSTMTPPPPPPTSAAYSPTSAAAAATAGKAPYHPMVADIHQAMNSSAAQLSLKNVDLLEAVERLTVMLDGVRVTFCKSGKDRTGMAVTLDQARQLSARYGLFNGLLAQSRHLSMGGGGGGGGGSSASSASSSTAGGANSNGNSNANTFASLLDERLASLANLMRVYGTRVAVAEKNIGRPVYSINLLQARFLPPLLRPPPAVCEAILKKDNS